ncbi:MAG TPA: L-threonylcarbamoyladenylate synthase, partial [Candidatus Saccharimonadales bacterium]
ISILLAGGVGVMPTDTIYGLVARAADKNAVARLYELKKREHKPGTIIAANIQQLAELGVEKAHLDQVAKWWPNPLSVVVPTSDGLFYLHLGLDSLPMRIPKDDQLRKLLEQTGPLLTSSANHTNMPGSNNISEAYAYFADDVDFYLDGGDLSGRPPSTLIHINPDKTISVLRDGAVKIDPGGLTG